MQTMDVSDAPAAVLGYAPKNIVADSSQVEGPAFMEELEEFLVEAEEWVQERENELRGATSGTGDSDDKDD